MAVFKRDGNWWIGYRGPDGKYHREKVGPSHKQAEDREAQRKTEVNEGKWFPARATKERTFEETIARHWELYGASYRSPSWSSIVREVRAVLGSKRTGAITAADVQSYYNTVAARASVSTANRHITLIRSIFNKARLRRDFHGENPCQWVKRSKEPNHRLRYLSYDEMKRLLSVAHPKLFPFISLGLYTGMRKGEILGLEWQNVDLESGVIHILKSKSGNARELPIPGRLRDILLELDSRPTGPVLGLPDITLRRLFAQALREAGLPSVGEDKVTIHTLRHTYGSWFTMKGGNIYTLQKLLGHSSISLTTRYSHLARGHLQSEVALLESAIPVDARSPQDCTKIALSQPAEFGPVGKVL